jgi:hypothetical protein
MKCNRSVKARLKVERTHSPWPLLGLRVGRYCIRLIDSKRCHVDEDRDFVIIPWYVVYRPRFPAEPRACDREFGLET